jgi:murein DD-endopeptidase MepM/ murein hydrolase activator NlpD
MVNDSNRLSDYIQDQLHMHHCKYGIGGYNEHRTIYARSRHFDGDTEPRRLHIGTDIWGPAGTKVMAPADGIVHSFAFNNNEGDYGATIIITHHLDGTGYHTLYGHLSLNSL